MPYTIEDVLVKSAFSDDNIMKYTLGEEVPLKMDYNESLRSDDEELIGEYDYDEFMSMRSVRKASSKRWDAAGSRTMLTNVLPKEMQVVSNNIYLNIRAVETLEKRFDYGMSYPEQDAYNKKIEEKDAAVFNSMRVFIEKASKFLRKKYGDTAEIQFKMAITKFGASKDGKRVMQSSRDWHYLNAIIHQKFFEVYSRYYTGR